MGRFFDLALWIFALQATVWGQAPEAPIAEQIENPSTTPSIKVTVTAKFPDAEIFGIKLVNGRATKATLEFSNEEAESVLVAFIGGSLWTPDFDPQGSRIVRNLTTDRHHHEIQPGHRASIPYVFGTEMHPQELRLNIAAVIADVHNTFHTVQAFNGTVSVVEPDTSIFDPQIIFLYLFILGCFAGVIYFFYNVWVQPYLFPKKRGGYDRTKKMLKEKKAATTEGIAAAGDATATTTGAKPYNEEWIPAHHINRPEAKKIKGSTPKPKPKGKAE